MAWVGLLARRWQSRAFNSAAASPSPAAGRVVDRSDVPHSQWRDRAAFSPVFPVTPSWAPNARSALDHGGADGSRRPRHPHPHREVLLELPQEFRLLFTRSGISRGSA